MSDNLHNFNDEVIEQDEILADVTTLKSQMTTANNNIAAVVVVNTTQTNQIAGSTSSGLKTLIEGNDTDIAAIKDKTDYLTVTGAINLDNVLSQTTANNAKVSMVIGSGGAQAMAGNTTVISSAQATALTAATNAIDAVEVKTDLFTVNGNDIYLGDKNFGINNSNPNVELEIGASSGPARIRLNGANGLAVSSELIFTDSLDNTAEYYQGCGIQYNSTDNKLNIVTDLGDDGTAEICCSFIRSAAPYINVINSISSPIVYVTDALTTTVVSKTWSIERGTIKCGNTDSSYTTKWVGMSSRLGALPGYSSSYYQVIESGTTLYFSVAATYVGYISSSYVAQIDFTGQHRAVPVDENLITNLQNNVGKIVISSGEISSLIPDASDNYHVKTGKNGITINEAIPIVELSNTYKDKRCFGVISDGEDKENNGEKHYKQGAFTSVLTTDPNDNRLTINSVGEGAILVSDICGNIENGDLITTSSIEGIGCLQDDDLVHNYTVAKSTINCDFNINSEKYNCYLDNNNNKIALISCIYLL